MNVTANKVVLLNVCEKAYKIKKLKEENHEAFYCWSNLLQVFGTNELYRQGCSYI